MKSSLLIATLTLTLQLTNAQHHRLRANGGNILDSVLSEIT